MKKSLIAVLFACAGIMMFAGCSNANNNVDNGVEMTETEGAQTQTSEEGENVLASVDFVYNVNDYVTLGDYMNVEVSINKADYEVKEEDINDYADQMIAYYKPYLPDETKTVVEKGDIVDVDYVGKKDGVAFEGGAAQAQMIDTAANADATTGNGYIEGFADGLIGVSVGETVDWEVTFPEDYSSEELKGQTVTFTFTVNSINTKVTRDTIDDAYVKEYMDIENVDTFYETIREMLGQQAQESEKADIRTKVLDAVAEICDVSGFPEGLFEKKVEENIEIFKKQYCADGTPLEEYLQQNYNMTEEEFLKETETYVEKNLKQELIFEAIAEKENIEFVEEEFQDYVSNIVNSGAFSSEEELYGAYGPTVEAGMKYLQMVYVQTKACVKIADQAKVTYVEEPVAESAQE